MLSAIHVEINLKLLVEFDRGHLTTNSTPRENLIDSDFEKYTRYIKNRCIYENKYYIHIYYDKCAMFFSE